MASLLDITLECPVCFEIPDGEVHQCKNGHTFCNNCLSKMTICPTCRVPLGSEKIRNLKYEKMLNLATVSCKFMDVGCNEKGNRKEMPSHVKSCVYQHRLIKICNSLGYKNCNIESNSLKRDDALIHFQTAHGFIVQNQRFANLRLVDFFQTTEYQSPIWTPVILKLVDEPNSPIFITTVQISARDKSLWMGCLFFEDLLKEIESEYKVTFYIETQNPKMDNIEWSILPTTFCSSIARSERMLKWPIFKLPIDFLKQHCLSDDGALNINVKVTTDHEQFEEEMENLAIGTDNLSLVSRARNDVADSVAWTCRECNSKIPNQLWYPCLQCPNWVLCQKCVDMGKHKQHILAMVKGHHQQRYFLMCALSNQEKFKPILPSEDDPTGNELDENDEESSFNECSVNGCYPIVGMIYICLLCPGTVVMCQKCVDKDNHRHHILGMIRNAKQEEFCDSLRANGSTLMPLLASKVNLS